MKIRVVAVSADQEYFRRFSRKIRKDYQERITLTVTDNFDDALKKAGTLNADILLADENMVPEAYELPKRCVLVLLVSDASVRSVDGIRALGKYQSVRQFCYDLTEIFSDQIESNNVQISADGSVYKSIITFFGAAGGTGCTTCAISYARFLSAQGKRVLYLNMDCFDDVSIYFDGDGKGDFGKVLYALEMDNESTAIRIENAMQQDASGVYYYAAAQNPLDMQDLDAQRQEILFEYLQGSRLIDMIVVDMKFTLGDEVVRQMERSDTVIFVSDGDICANTKLRRISESLDVLANSEEKLLQRNLLLMYNRFSSLTGRKEENTHFSEVGGIGRIENASPSDLIEIISGNHLFYNIYDVG